MGHYLKPSISADAAERALGAARAAAAASGIAAAISVCDEAGQVKAFLRMDGASFAAGRIAEDKAYTAAAFGVPTGQWFTIHEGDKSLRDGMRNSIDRLSTLGGGVAIVIDGSIIGAVGVSGGSAEQDHQIAQAAADAAAP